MSPHLILGAQAGHFGGPLFRIESAPDCEAQGAAVAGLKVVDFDHFTQYPMNHHRLSSWASSWHFRKSY